MTTPEEKDAIAVSVNMDKSLIPCALARSSGR
jgi:hypothetical protein